MSFANQPLIIAGRTFHSRLILGTVALRRADLSGQKDTFANILEFVDPKKSVPAHGQGSAEQPPRHTKVHRQSQDTGPV